MRRGGGGGGCDKGGERVSLMVCGRKSRRGKCTEEEKRVVYLQCDTLKLQQPPHSSTAPLLFGLPVHCWTPQLLSEASFDVLLVWRRSAVFYTPPYYSLQYWIDQILLWVPEVHCFQNKSHRNVLCF